jgi:hypothetical protein
MKTPERFTSIRQWMSTTYEGRSDSRINRTTIAAASLLLVLGGDFVPTMWSNHTADNKAEAVESNVLKNLPGAQCMRLGKVALPKDTLLYEQPVAVNVDHRWPWPDHTNHSGLDSDATALTATSIVIGGEKWLGASTTDQGGTAEVDWVRIGKNDGDLDLKKLPIRGTCKPFDGSPEGLQQFGILIANAKEQ